MKLDASVRKHRASGLISSTLLFALSFVLLIAASPARAQSTASQIVVALGPQQFQASTYRLNPATGALTALTTSNLVSNVEPPFAYAINPAGTYYFVAAVSATNYTEVYVYAIDQTTGVLTQVANSPFATGLGYAPAAMITDRAGQFLYVGNTQAILDGQNSEFVGEIDTYSISASGQLTPTPGMASWHTAPTAPGTINSLWMHPNNLWLYLGGDDLTGTQQKDLIVEYTVNSTTGDLPVDGKNYIGGDSNQFDYLYGTGFAADPNGKFLVDSYVDNECNGLAIAAISSADGSLSLAGQPWSGQTANCKPGTPFLAVDPTGKFLYTTWGIFGVSSSSLTPPAAPAYQALPGTYYLPDPAGTYVLANNNEVLTANTVARTTGALTPVSTLTISSLASFVVSGSATFTPAPEAVLQPTELSFASLGVGNPTASQNLTLANPGTANLNITNISVTGTNAADFAQTNNCGTSLAPGASCIFTIIYTGSTADAESATVSVTDNAAGSPHTAALTATAYVVPPPNPSVTPTALSFPSTAVGATSPLTFTIANSGGQTLNVASITISGANPGDFTQSGSCATVAPNASCTVTVTFQPQAQGVRSANVVVTYSGISNPIGGVMLSGTGTAPVVPFVVAPTGPTSSTVAAGQPATYGMSFTPMAGFAGTATVSCSVSPAGPTCSASPATIQVAASNSPATTPVAVTVSTATTARKTSLLASLFFNPRAPKDGSLKSVAGLASLTFGFLGIVILGTRRRTAQLAFVSRTIAVTLLVLSMGLMSACGGGVSSGGGGNTPQTYSVSVTTTAGATTQAVNYTLTVQ
jgi:hypothetical protein